MDQSFMFKNLYAREVLGIKSYLCPPSIQALRSLEGGLPSSVLVLVFQSLTPSQKVLLKKFYPL